MSVPAPSEAPGLVHHLPIATTLLAVAFVGVLVRRARLRDWPPHLLWWVAGVFAYGAGTALESAITLCGNSAALTRSWYLAGAILGGYPLATGTVYLICRRRVAHALTAVSGAVVLALGTAVLLSPLHIERLQPFRPSGDVLSWTWLRACTPFVNLYAAVFLIGGAMQSAVRFWWPDVAGRSDGRRAAGTALIAAGALLPAIGGGMAKAGLVEGLYVGELAGLLLIWWGYEFCVRSPSPAPSPRAEASRPATSA